MINKIDMKTKKHFFLPIFLLIALVISSYQSKSINCNITSHSFIHQDSTIIGLWNLEDDNNWKLKFRNDSICEWQLTDEPTRNYYFHISTTSPQCGEAVETGAIYNYLQLTNVNDSTDKVCYLINGITDTHLSLSTINLGGAFVFVKQ